MRFRWIQPFGADDAFDAFLPGVILSLDETELDITVAVGRSAEPGKSFLDCDFFSGEQKQFGAAVVADLRAGKAVFVVVFGEGLSVVHLGQLVEGIVDEQTFFGDLRQPSVNEILADGSVFWIVLVMGRNGALRIHHILSADLSIAADILAQREMVEVEGQIDEILLGGVFQLGDADEELIVFVIVEALHPLCEVVQLVQIGEAVFQHGEFFRPVDLCHEGRLRGFLAFDGMDLTKLCKQFTLADREADVDFVIGILDSDFDHGAHSFHRK